MSKRWLVILLFVSFSFNLAVLGSFFYFRLIMPPHCPPPPMEHRGMGPGQGFMRDDPEIETLHNRFNDTKLNLMQELAKDPINEAKISTIIDSSLIAQNQLERTLGAKMLAYRKTMSAEEAREHFQRRMDRVKMRSQRIEKIRNRRQP